MMFASPQTSNTPIRPHYSCIIIGAGISGLTTAVKLAKEKHKVLILEARDRIGGRIHSLTDTLPCAIDLGATELHGYDEGNPLKKIATSINAHIHKPKDRDWIIFGPHEKPLNPETSRILQRNVTSAIFDSSIDYAQLQSTPSVSVSLADYIFAEGSPLYESLTADERSIATSLANSWCSWTGTPFSDVSLKYWGFARDITGAPAYAEKGYSQFVNHLWTQASTLGVQLKLEHEAVAIEDCGEDGLRVVVKTSTSLGSGETTFTAQTCICTIPLGVLQNNPPRFSPPLPPRRLGAIQRVGVGSFTKVFISYPYVWWPADKPLIYIVFNENFPQIYPALVSDYENVKAAGRAILAQRAVEVRNFAEMNGAPVLSIDFGPPAAQQLETHTTLHIKTALHALLIRYLGRSVESVPQPDICVVTRWNHDPYSMGAYSNTPASKDLSLEPSTPLDFVELSKPLWNGRLGFAGEHTDLDHSASAHGAMFSGEREADRLLLLLGQAGGSKANETGRI